MLPGISNINDGNVKKVYTAELVADSTQTVEVTDHTINTRKMHTTVRVQTDRTADRIDLERREAKYRGVGML